MLPQNLFINKLLHFFCKNSISQGTFNFRSKIQRTSGMRILMSFLSSILMILIYIARSDNILKADVFSQTASPEYQH